jgi:hypothetical protein
LIGQVADQGEVPLQLDGKAGALAYTQLAIISTFSTMGGRPAWSSSGGTVSSQVKCARGCPRKCSSASR